VLEDEINFQGADIIAAMIMEPILGARGVIPPHPSFMPKVREICARRGILLIADEVTNRFGRSGDWTGARHGGGKPDFSCTAKAIPNGYFQFGAVMIAQEIAETFKTNTSGGAAIGLGYTYSGHPVGAPAAIACLKETQRPDVKTNAGLRGGQFFKGLWRLGEKYDLIGEVRGGHGLRCALELVSDRTQKTPIDKQTIQRLQTAAYKGGVMLRVSGPNVIFPLIIDEADTAQILQAVDRGFASL